MKDILFKRIISSLFLFPSTLLIIINGKLIFNLLLIFLFIISIYEWFLITRSFVYRLNGIFLIFFSFISCYLIRTNDAYNGLNFFIFIFLICIATDIGGYIFGNILKGPKLTKISPNKTFSGVLGSFLLPIFLIYFMFDNNLFLNFEEINVEINKFILIFLISLISQIGDILISFLKRKVKMKDTGNIIPGHGGLLDRIDGMIFAFPFSFILNHIL